MRRTLHELPFDESVFFPKKATVVSVISRRYLLKKGFIKETILGIECYTIIYGNHFNKIAYRFDPLTFESLYADVNFLAIGVDLVRVRYCHEIERIIEIATSQEPV